MTGAYATSKDAKLNALSHSDLEAYVNASNTSYVNYLKEGFLAFGTSFTMLGAGAVSDRMWPEPVRDPIFYLEISLVVVGALYGAYAMTRAAGYESERDKGRAILGAYKEPKIKNQILYIASHKMPSND